MAEFYGPNIKFAILGTEEGCSGDPAKRAGNEFLFQMQAMQNISILNGYEIKKIVTGCPHCFNTIKNELETKNPITETVANKISNTPTTSSSKEMLAESKAYENPQFKRMKDLMSKIK